MEENETDKMTQIPLENDGFLNRGNCGQTKDCVTLENSISFNTWQL